MSFDLLDNYSLDNYSLDNQPNFPERTLPVGFMLRLAKALHTYGMTAYELENNMRIVGEKLGFGVQCLSQPTNIIMSFSHPKEPEPKTYVFRVDPGEVNLERQIQVDHVVALVTAGGLSVEDGARKLKSIGSSPIRFGAPYLIAGFGLVSGAIARILGGAVGEIVVAFLIGLLIGFIAVKLLRSENSQFLFPTIAAMISALAASLVAHLGWLASPYIATLSGVIVLVPGLLLTTAIAELARQNMVSGTARLFSAGTIFMQIGFGVAIGNGIGESLFPATQVEIQLFLPYWTEWGAIFLASVGLFFLFQSRPKDFVWVILAGVIAYGSTVFGAQHLGAVMGSFVGALTMGLASNSFERLFKVTRSVMLMPGIILLVPGSVGFQSLSLLVEKNIIEGLDTAFKMGFVAIALVTGLLVASLIIPPTKR